MEQYRFDPYTGQPLNQRTGNNLTWLGNGYQTGGPAQYSQPPAQPQPSARVEQPGVIFRLVASYDEAKAVPTDFSGALIIMLDWAHGCIYTKALGDDGNPLFRTYRYDPRPLLRLPSLRWNTRRWKRWRACGRSWRQSNRNWRREEHPQRTRRRSPPVRGIRHERYDSEHYPAGGRRRKSHELGPAVFRRSERSGPKSGPGTAHDSGQVSSGAGADRPELGTGGRDHP